MARKISELFFELRAKTEGLKADLDASERHLGKWSTFVASNPIAVAGALGAVLLGIGIKATVMAAETDKAIRSITANMPAGTASAAQLRAEISGVANDAGVAKSEIASLATEVARLGAGSHAEFAAKLNGAQLLSDATGIDSKAAAQGIDQLADLFETGADRIVGSIASIASAARGRVDFESIFGAFQASAPRIRELGLSVDEATKAIVKLADEGRSAKQVTKILNEHDAEQIRAYGADVKLSANALKELHDRAEEVRTSVPRTAQSIRNELNDTLEQLGTRILPIVNADLLALKNIIDGITHATDPKQLTAYVNALRDVGNAAIAHGVKPAIKTPEAGALERAADELRTAVRKGDFEVGSLSTEDAERVRRALEINLRLIEERWRVDHDGHAMSAADSKIERATFAEVFDALDKVIAKKREASKPAGSGGATSLGLTIDERKKVDTDLAETKKAIDEFGQSTKTVIAGSTKSAVDNALAELDAFADKYLALAGEIQKKIKALPANTPTADRTALDRDQQELADSYAAGIAARQKAIEALAVQEASTLRSTIRKQLGELTGALAAQGADAIEQQNKALREQVLFASKLSEAEKLRLLDNIKLLGILEQQKNIAADATRDVPRIVETADLAGPTNDSFTAINAKAIALHGVLRQLVADGGEQAKQGEGYRDIQEAILKLDKERADLLKKLLGIEKDGVSTARDELQLAADRARALHEAVDGALQLASAFGLVDQKSLNILRSIGQVATQLPNLVAQLGKLGEVGKDGKPLATLGSVAGAALPVLGGVASLVSLITAESPAQRAQREAFAANTQALKELTKLAAGGGLLGTSGLSGLTGTVGITAHNALADMIASIKKEIGSNGYVAPDFKVDITKHFTPEQVAALEEAAKRAGIQLDGTIGSLFKLNDALSAGLPILGKFGHTVADMFNEIDADAKIFGKNSPLDNLAALFAKIGPQSAGIASIFKDIDTSKALTPQAIATIRQRVQELFKTMEGAGLTLDQLGGLDGDQFLQLLEQIIGDLDQLGSAAQSASDKLKAALTSTEQDLQIHDVKDPLAQFKAKAKAYAGSDAGGLLGELLGGFDLDNLKAEDIAALDAKFQELFDQLKTSTGSVDLAGLSIDELKAALLELHGAADSVAAGIATAAQKIADAEGLLQTSDAILGTSPTEQAQEKGNLYGFDLGDISSQAGVDTAIANLRALFKSLDPASADFKERSREILNTIQALQGITFDATPAPARSATASSTSAGSGDTEAIANAARGITAVDGNRMANFLATILQVNRDELATANKMLAAMLQPVITGPILPPALPSWFGSAGASAVPAPTQTAAANGPPSVIQNFRFDLHIDGATIFADRKDVKLWGDELVTYISRGIADHLRNLQRLQGDTTISS